MALGGHQVSRSCLPHHLASPGERCPRTQKARRCAGHEAAFQRWRNAKPERRELYLGDWPAESRAIRAAHPYCSECGSVDQLTVDHPLRRVFCRSCHGRLEAGRRAEAKRSS